MLTRKDITYNHLVGFRGNDGKINNKDCRFLITENDDNDENHIDCKNIITNELLKQGDYINIDNINHMVIDKTNVLESSYYIGVFRKALPIKLGSTLKNIDAVIDKKSTVLNDTGEIVDTHDQYQFIVPSIDLNNKTNKVSLSSQIIFDGGLYEIISIDTTREDLILYICKFIEVYNPHVYTIELSEISKTIVEGATYQISNVICKDNGTIVPNPTLTYTSSDTSIASVDDKGLVIGVKAGSCNISVNYNNTIVTLSLVANIKPHEIVISYSTTSSNGYSYRVKEGATITYTKTVDGVIDNTLDISFTLDTTGTSLVNSAAISVVKKTSNTIQVRNLTITTVKSFLLTVTDSSNGKVISPQTITTRSA